MESKMKPIKRESDVAEVPAPAAPGKKAVVKEEQAPAAPGKKVVVKEEPGIVLSATEEEASAIIRAAKRALEEEAAAGGKRLPPVLRSLQRFLAQRWAAAVVKVQSDGGSTSPRPS